MYKVFTKFTKFLQSLQRFAKFSINPVYKVLTQIEKLRNFVESL